MPSEGWQDVSERRTRRADEGAVPAQRKDCQKDLIVSDSVTLAWIVLIASGTLEAVWASALAASSGLKRLWPSLLFIVSLALSMAGLAFAMLTLPAGTAYAVWVGIGAVLTAAWAIATKRERATVVRVLLLAGLIACVVGLKAVS